MAPPSAVFLSTVEPEPFKRLAVQESPDGTDARPVAQPLDQPFLTAVGQDIAQPLETLLRGPGATRQNPETTKQSPGPRDPGPGDEVQGLGDKVRGS
jgi:hypothetical protein